MKMYVVIRPSMKGTNIPSYNYTFADSESEAISKVRLKYGEYDTDAKAREISEEEIERLVIGTDYYG